MQISHHRSRLIEEHHIIANAMPTPPISAAGTARGGATTLGPAAPDDEVAVEGSAVLV